MMRGEEGTQKREEETMRVEQRRGDTKDNKQG